MSITYVRLICYRDPIQTLDKLLKTLFKHSCSQSYFCEIRFESQSSSYPYLLYCRTFWYISFFLTCLPRCIYRVARWRDLTVPDLPVSHTTYTITTVHSASVRTGTSGAKARSLSLVCSITQISSKR